MSEYIPPCLQRKCELGQDRSETMQAICKDFARCIIEAGGAGLLENTLCPYEALDELRPENSDNPILSKIRANLKIVGYF